MLEINHPVLGADAVHVPQPQVQIAVVEDTANLNNFGDQRT